MYTYLLIYSIFVGHWNTPTRQEKEMNEKLIERKLTKLVKQNGGLSLKFTSPGFDGVPDRLLLFSAGRAMFAEIKTTGKRPRRLQLHRHEMLRSMGFKVFVIDDVDQIDEIIEEIKNEHDQIEKR